MEHLSSAPVIRLSMKDISAYCFEASLQSLKYIIQEEYKRHFYLKNSLNLSLQDKEQYLNIFKEDCSTNDIKFSLQNLIRLLNKHYSKKVIVLIDEFDEPIESSINKDCYNQKIDLFRLFYSSALKDNENICYGIMTGVVQVAKESLFSSLNNVKVCTILNRNWEYSFGFSKK